jgi:6-phosphogluconolactonase
MKVMRTMKLCSLGMLGVALIGALGATRAADRLVYVGTYTAGTESQGIYAFRFNDQTGTLTPVGLAAATANPSFLTATRDHRYVFAVNEVSTYQGSAQGAASGSVTSFRVDGQTGRLDVINTESSRGADPCHLTLDTSEHTLAVANYTGGNFALLPVGANGMLQPATAVLANTGSGPNRERQEAPHAHAVVFDRTNQFLLGADLGTDRVWNYRFTARTGGAVPHAPSFASVAAGAGPRHLAWHPNGRFLFSVNELQSTVTSFNWDEANGRLTPGSTVSTLPPGFVGENSTAEIAVHPNGRFLYASNRGHDSVAVFRISTTGDLERRENVSTRGQTPRNFALSPDGRWLIAANQTSGTLAVFRIDLGSGQLSAVGPTSSLAAPVCVLFL